MYNRKKPVEEVPQENTPIWACTNDGCKGWMRDNFTFDYVPTCRLCDSPMDRDMKMLPLLENIGGTWKSNHS